MAGIRDYDKDGKNGSYYKARLKESAVTMLPTGNMLLLKFVIDDGPEISVAVPIKSLGWLREYYDSVVASFPGMLAEMDG